MGNGPARRSTRLDLVTRMLPGPRKTTPPRSAVLALAARPTVDRRDSLRAIERTAKQGPASETPTGSPGWSHDQPFSFIRLLAASATRSPCSPLTTHQGSGARSGGTKSSLADGENSESLRKWFRSNGTPEGQSRSSFRAALDQMEEDSGDRLVVARGVFLNRGNVSHDPVGKEKSRLRSRKHRISRRWYGKCFDSGKIARLRRRRHDNSDRRRYHRFPCSLDVVVYSLPHPTCHGLVYDVSNAGVGLASVQHYQPGSLVSLASPDENESIVVKVACANYKPSVGWLIGCVFA